MNMHYQALSVAKSLQFCCKIQSQKLETLDAAEPIYTILGVPVDLPKEAGIYIQKGKKIIVK